MHHSQVCFSHIMHTKTEMAFLKVTHGCDMDMIAILSLSMICIKFKFQG